MNVAILVGHLHARGGTQRQALELARSLVRSGHSVTTFSTVLDRGACFPELTSGLDIRSLEAAGVPGLPRKPRPFPKWAKRAVALGYELSGQRYRRELHALTAGARQLADLVLEAGAERFDVVNPHDFGVASWAAALIRQRTGLPVVWQCNDPMMRWDRPLGGIAARERARLLGADAERVRSFDAVTVLDHGVAAEIRGRFGVDPVVVRSGVDHDRRAPPDARERIRTRLRLPSDAVVVLVLTLLNGPYRRVDDAITAIEQLPGNARLLIVAPAPEAPSGGYPREIHDRIATSPARDRIVWHRDPLRGEGELQELFAAADVFLFPNVNQTWGLAVIEAAAAGLPVVVSNGAGAHEVFSSGRDALVYEGGRVDRLVESLRELLDRPRRRAELARAGQEMVRARFSWDRYGQDMAAVFSGCVRAAKRGVA